MAALMRKLNDIFSRNRTNWLEKLKSDDLRIEKRKLELGTERVAKEVKDLEKEKTKLFNEGVGKPFLEKRMLAQKIKELDVKAKMKYIEFDRVQKMSRAIFNLTTVLKRREQLKEKGLWQKLQALTPDQLLTELSKQDIKDKEFERAVEDILRILERPIADIEGVDTETQEVMELWSKVERKEMAPEEVTKKLSIEESLKEKEHT